MSNTSEGQIVLPNPYTPMAFLPPEVAFQTTIKTYVAIGTTAVLIWDILSHLSDDYRLLTRHRIGLPTVTYFVSRISILLYIIGCDIFYTAPFHSCLKLGQFLAWLFPIMQASTSLLFVLRVCAIYSSNYYICAFFAIAWLAEVGSTLTVGLGLNVGNIGTTSYCKSMNSTLYTGVTFISPLVLDTSVFIAITWRLVRNKLVDYSLSQGVRIIVFGDYLPIFSKSLLQDGQMYYLTTLTTSLGTVILYFLPFAPDYKVLLLLPNLILTNIMACRVYRNTKFGSCDSEDESRATAQLRFNMTTGRSTEPVVPLYPIKEPQRLRETQTRQNFSVTDPDERSTGIIQQTDTCDIQSGEKVLTKGP